MAAVLLIAHAPLASALLSVAGHCYEEKGHLFEAIDVEPTMSAETVEALAREALGRLNAQEVLVLTDVFGATPCCNSPKPAGRAAKTWNPLTSAPASANPIRIENREFNASTDIGRVPPIRKRDRPSCDTQYASAPDYP